MSRVLKNTYAVILAGGVGSRFWPKSRESKPKQYLSLIDEGTLLQNTAARLRGLFTEDSIFVVSNRDQENLLHAQLPWLPNDHVFFEPMGRNTAPAIGLAAIHLIESDPDAHMVVLPADHRITNTQLFLDTLQLAIDFVQDDQNALVTFGIKPSYPATGYGYIESGAPVRRKAFRVTRFTEKPNRELATEFIRQGNYFWNSGMFVWRAATILKEIERYMPEWHAGLLDIQSALCSDNHASVCEKVYSSLRGQSIDFGVMEKADHVYVVQADFGWSDLGTWEQVYNSSPKDENGNVIKGRPLLLNVSNSYIDADDRLVSIIGVEDLIVIDQPDALLICKKEKSQDVRWVAKELESAGKKNAS
ncbi:mannose-1-phosphate guanylyltransferase [candidate division KSB1 bacterium]|nr:mannose-1-phosphate guanylyltransferase [candidate division KSB1 bacterium]RQW10000.1 MAG: mannose-1-phosphate guanylyltransferase [candidate division KSB1 bacterium]